MIIGVLSYAQMCDRGSWTVASDGSPRAVSNGCGRGARLTAPAAAIAQCRGQCGALKPGAIDDAQPNDR